MLLKNIFKDLLIFDKNKACFLSAFLFMIAHPFHTLGLYGIIMQAGLTGIMLAYVALYYNSIYVTFGLHLANNLVTRLLYSSNIFCLVWKGEPVLNFDVSQIFSLVLFMSFFLYQSLWKTKLKKLFKKNIVIEK